jgi:hypothetical protein
LRSIIRVDAELIFPCARDTPIAEASSKGTSILNLTRDFKPAMKKGRAPRIVNRGFKAGGRKIRKS